MIISPSDRLSGVPEYYFSKKLKEIAKLNSEGQAIINLGIGSPDLPPAPEVIAELQTWSAKPNVHGYQSYVGVPELREAIATWMHRQYAIRIDAENEVLPLIGSKEGIMHISMAFLNAGDKVLVPDPGYLTYSAVARLLQAECIPYYLSEVDNWKVDLKHLLKLPLDDVKLMWVNFPNMPTGAPGSTEQFEQLIDLARAHNFLIVNDNPYGMLFTGARRSILQTDGAKEVAMELNSLSKSHNMAGWRLGWLSGAADYLRAVLQVKSNMDSGMFLPLQKAAAKAISLSEDWYDRLNQLYAQRRVLAFEILDILDCHYDRAQEGMFVWAKVPGSIEHVESWVDEMIYKAGVFITPGFIFGQGGHRFVRISLCSNEDTFHQSIERLRNFQHNYQV